MANTYLILDKAKIYFWPSCDWHKEDIMDILPDGDKKTASIIWVPEESSDDEIDVAVLECVLALKEVQSEIS